jgi:predicted nucleic acid-binding protein
MLAVGTNVPVRLFANDDAAQAHKARARFDAHAGENDAAGMTDVVWAELV